MITKTKPPCRQCGGQLGKYKRAFCSESCAQTWSENNIWQIAVLAALKRTHRTCEHCGWGGGWGGDGLEVHHIKPLNGARGNNDQNNQDNLLVLCRACHVALHRVMRGVAVRTVAMAVVEAEQEYKGTAQVQSPSMGKCPRCSGLGGWKNDLPAEVPRMIICTDCHGAGIVTL